MVFHGWAVICYTILFHRIETGGHCFAASLTSFNVTSGRRISRYLFRARSSEPTPHCLKEEPTALCLMNSTVRCEGSHSTFVDSTPFFGMKISLSKYVRMKRYRDDDCMSPCYLKCQSSFPKLVTINDRQSLALAASLMHCNCRYSGGYLLHKRFISFFCHATFLLNTTLSNLT